MAQGHAGQGGVGDRVAEEGHPTGGDENPKQAAAMANDIVDLIDTIKNEMIRERTIPAFQINLRKKQQMEKERDSILKRLEDLAELGVLPNDTRATLYQALVDAKNPQEKVSNKSDICFNRYL
jgi:hypothetical protein